MYRRPAPLALFAALCLLAAVVTAGPALAQDAEEEAPSPRIWWNVDRFAEPLGLTSEQQSTFDAELRDYLQSRREQGRAHQEARQKMFDALLEDDWEAVESLRDEVESTAVALAAAELDFRLRIFRALDTEQRKKMADDFPRLLQRSWILGGLRPRERGGPRVERRREGT